MIAMDIVIKILKIVLLLIAIIIGIGVLFGMFFVYKGMQTGDLEGYVQKTAIENVVDEDKLTPEQRQMLDSGDIDGLVEDLKDNVTQEQIDCAIGVVGEKRALELVKLQNPTPQELFLLSKCL